MARIRNFALVALFHTWIVLSEVSDQKQCSTLKVSGDQLIKMNGYYAPDLSLQTMYKYDEFINYTVFKHFHKNRIIFFIGEPFYWVVGKAEYIYTGNFWYTNRSPKLIGPWFTGYKKNPNNVSVTCEEIPGKTKMSDSANTLHPKLMFLEVAIKIVIMVRSFRFFAPA